MMLFKRIVIVATLLWFFCFGQQESSAQKFLFLIGGGVCAQANNYLNATTINSNHQGAITNYICGQVTSGVFALLDVWYLLQNDNASSALTNIINPGTFNGTAAGVPTFTADVGYTGVAASSTVHIDTGFNPTTAPTPHFTQNSASVHIWVVAGSTEAHAAVGLFSTTQNTSILPRHTTNAAFYRINDGSVASGGIATATPLGLYSAIRTGASAQKGYKNAVDQGVISVASGAQLNGTIYVLGAHGIGTGSDGSSDTVAIYASGAALSAGQVASFCTASNVVLNVISGLSLGTC